MAKRKPNKSKGKAPAARSARKKAGKGKPDIAPKRKLKAVKPRQPRLGGVEMAKDSVLDRACETIRGCRDQMSDLRETEQGAIQSALRRMHAKQEQTNEPWQFYKAHGVELSRVTGDEKLRVRVTKDDNGPADGEEDLDGGGNDDASGQEETGAGEANS